MFDPFTNFNLDKFSLMLIPKMFLDELPSLATAFLVTLFPYTPVGVVVFTVIFLIVYVVNPLGAADKKIHYCRFNKPEERSETSLWVALKTTYYYYFIIMILINHSAVSRYHTMTIKAI